MASTKKPLKKGRKKLKPSTLSKSLISKTVAKKAKAVGIWSFLQKPLSIALIFLGSFIIFFAAGNFMNLDWQHPFLPQKPESAGQNQPSPKPQTLYIPKLNRVLNVSDGQYSGSRWVISPTGVSFLTTSATPGQKGNSVIYGHNLDSILGYLPQVQNGDKIYVVLSDGNIAAYQVTQTSTVDPTHVEILDQTADSRLTIYTCTGFLDTARFVVVAKQTNLI